jgi:hypothetical protein
VPDNDLPAGSHGAHASGIGHGGQFPLTAGVNAASADTIGSGHGGGSAHTAASPQLDGPRNMNSIMTAAASSTTIPSRFLPVDRDGRELRERPDRAERGMAARVDAQSAPPPRLHGLPKTPAPETRPPTAGQYAPHARMHTK